MCGGRCVHKLCEFILFFVNLMTLLRCLEVAAIFFQAVRRILRHAPSIEDRCHGAGVCSTLFVPHCSVSHL